MEFEPTDISEEKKVDKEKTFLAENNVEYSSVSKDIVDWRMKIRVLCPCLLTP
jgi:hypothetical protein